MTSEKFYMVHRHDAKRAGLHYDLRLEQNGVLKSWAIPKGMPVQGGRHLAIQTTDHSMKYGKWEGTIESGYGAGDVKIDTSGTYKTLSKSGKNVPKNLRSRWKFEILSGKYQGIWNLVHWKGDKWLISKSKTKESETFGVDYDYVPHQECAWCGKDGKFMIYHLPVGPKSFCRERCYTRYAGLDDSPEGFYGYDAEDYTTFTDEMETFIGRYGQLVDYESEFHSQERGGDGIMKVWVSFRPDNPDFDSWTLDAEGQADKIEIGDKVRSYDFVLGGKTYDEGSYIEGIVVAIEPVSWCGPNCNHYHIRTTARYIRNEPRDYEDMYFPPVNEYDTDVRKVSRITGKEAENWGGDPDGALAKALAQARAKSKKPRKALKIETLDAETNGDIFKKEALLFGIGIASAVVGTFLAEVLLDKYREDPVLTITEDEDEMV